MTTKNHTDIPFAAPATSSVLNAPLGQLDAALADAQAVFGDFVAAGGLPGGSGSLAVTQPACRAFVLNTYVSVAATTLIMSASKDNYVDLDTAGAYHITPVALGALGPAIFANSIRLYKAVAGVGSVTSIVDLRPTAASPAVALTEPAMVPGANRNEHVVQRAEQGVAYLFDSTGNAGGDSAQGINDCLTCAVPPSHTVYGCNQANLFQSIVDGGAVTTLFTFPAGEIISAVLVLSTGTIIVFTTDLKSVATPSTFTYIYRSTNGGTAFTKVASSAAVIGNSVQLVVGNYMAMFSVAQNGTVACAGLYGYKAGGTARYVYRSADDGVTWAVGLDIGSNVNRHVHQVYADPNTNHLWVTTGDENTGRQVYLSTDNGVTWTPSIFLDIDGATRLQFLAIVAYRGWIYMGEDNDARGRIVRFKESNITGTVEVIYDPDVDGNAATFAGLLAASPWVAPVYSFGVDPVYNVLYVYTPGESAAPYMNHGRFMVSADGVNFTVWFETGTGIVPGTAAFSIQAFTGGYYVYYANIRMKRRLGFRAQGIRPADQMVITFSIPGAVATQAEVFALNPAMLGFNFRVVRAGIFLQTASTGAVTAAFKKNGNDIGTVDAIVGANAVGAARYADITLQKADYYQVFYGPEADFLTCDITNAGAGGSGLTGFIVIEKQAGPLLAK